MLTTDLCAMRFYCFDYYLEHLERPKLKFRSDADKCRFNKYPMLRIERFLYAKYLEYSLGNTQNCKHKIILTFFFSIVKYHNMNAETGAHSEKYCHRTWVRDTLLGYCVTDVFQKIFIMPKLFYFAFFHAGISKPAEKHAESREFGSTCENCF